MRTSRWNQSLVTNGIPAEIKVITAKTINGPLMIGGDSCAWSYRWWSRGLPVKVRNRSRNM